MRLTSNKRDYNTPIITGAHCANLLGRRKILRLYWLAPPLCMNENRHHASRHARRYKKSEGIRTCPHFAITILYCVFRRSSYYHFLRRTVSVSYNVDAFLQCLQLYTVDGIDALNPFFNLSINSRCYTSSNMITFFRDSEN